MGTFLKVVILLLAVWAVGLLLRRALRQARGSDDADNTRQGRLDSSAMVACAHCRLYVPRQEAFVRSGYYYCSSEHARATKRR